MVSTDGPGHPARVTRDDQDGIAVISLDTPGRSMNVVDRELVEQLAAHVQALEADASVTAVVLRSAKPGSFGAGADVAWLPTLLEPDGAAFLSGLHDLMYRIVAAPKPWVAAVHGAALGGAFEIALATEAIVVTPSATVGLPEVTLGLIPGGAGTQLISRWVSTAAAIDLMAGGKPLTAEQALKAGLAGQIAELPDLTAAAVARARALAQSGERRPVRQDTEEAARAEVARRQAEGANEHITTAVAAGIEGGPGAGCQAEREQFLKALAAPESKALRHLFLAEARLRRRPGGAVPRVTRLGIVGAGLMGSGLAATAVTRGLTATVRDLTDDQLHGARDYLLKVLKRTGAGEAETAGMQSRWHATTGWDGFAEAQAVIEAVFELPAVKRETLTALGQLVPDETLIATNTSAIPIATLAASVTSPERFLGMHFFSPVERMNLVELVPHGGTSPGTLDRAAALARSLGKTPVVVADRPGFFTSRVYARWLIEGIRLLLEGVPPAGIESAAKEAGFPVGPLQACDEVTVGLVIKASLDQVAEHVMAGRIDVAAVKGALEKLIESGIAGRRAGRGFYSYEAGRRCGLNPDVPRVLGVEPRPLDAGTVRDRLLLSFASESFLCWDDGTLRHPDDGDVASVLGIGFPRTLGGPFQWADQIGAASAARLSARLGPAAFPVGETVAELASGGGCFAGLPRREG